MHGVSVNMLDCSFLARVHENCDLTKYAPYVRSTHNNCPWVSLYCIVGDVHVKIGVLTRVFTCDIDFYISEFTSKCV